MSLEYALLRNHLLFFEDDLLLEIVDYVEWIELEYGMQLLKEGQYVKGHSNCDDGAFKSFYAV